MQTILNGNIGNFFNCYVPVHIKSLRLSLFDVFSLYVCLLMFFCFFVFLFFVFVFVFVFIIVRSSCLLVGRSLLLDPSSFLVLWPFCQGFTLIILGQKQKVFFFS